MFTFDLNISYHYAAGINTLENGTGFPVEPSHPMPAQQGVRQQPAPHEGMAAKTDPGGKTWKDIGRVQKPWRSLRL